MDKIEIEKWLKENTFECPHGLGRLSPKQCEANRKRPSIGHSHWSNFSPPKPGPCETCKEWKEAINKMQENRKKASVKVITCRECGQERRHYARGLCERCYARLSKQGMLDKKYPKNRTKLYKITIPFYNYPDLYETIIVLARQEMRPVSTQILYIVKKWLEEHYEKGK